MLAPKPCDCLLSPISPANCLALKAINNSMHGQAAIGAIILVLLLCGQLHRSALLAREQVNGTVTANGKRDVIRIIRAKLLLQISTLVRYGCFVLRPVNSIRPLVINAVTVRHTIVDSPIKPLAPLLLEALQQRYKQRPKLVMVPFGNVTLQPRRKRIIVIATE